jgi:diguanylate cyclase (GGDEF)-like protein
MSLRTIDSGSNESGLGAVSLVAAMRRLAGVADKVSEPEDVRRAMARELMVAVGAEEVIVHGLHPDPNGRELVVTYLYEGEGRLSYLASPAERPAAVSWVASTGRSFLAAGERELIASVPRNASGPAPVRCALLVPLVVQGETEAIVVLVSREQGRFSATSLEQASSLVEQAATALALVRARVEAGTDAVTGCMNHRAMRRRLTEEVARAGRAGSKLSCMLIDLDDFKLVNDRHGHGAGDAVLRGVAETLMGEFRAFDRVARYGGDEFVVILPETDLQSAAIAAERARERLQGITIVSSRGTAASIGVAEWREGMSVDQLLEACDEALLAGKQAGKQRVIVAR